MLVKPEVGSVHSKAKDLEPAHFAKGIKNISSTSVKKPFWNF